MELFQHASNPWGQEILTHISWSLFWWAVLAAVAFFVGHLVFRDRQARRARAAGSGGGQVVRHSLAARGFHWLMAVSMLVLLVTGFLPQVGVQFSWLTLHWVFGLLLIASILFHIVHATFFQSLRNIWISLRDVREWWQEVRHVLGSAPAPPKPGKYPVDHKLYHHMVTLTGFGAMVTGVLMMFRIDVPFWERNPYLFSDSSWGIIYVVHGLSGVLLVTLTMVHVYFAILPEKRWITWSMIHGRISRRDYQEHHDPARWTAPPAADGAEESSPQGAARAEAG